MTIYTLVHHLLGSGRMCQIHPTPYDEDSVPLVLMGLPDWPIQLEAIADSPIFALATTTDAL